MTEAIDKTEQVVKDHDEREKDDTTNCGKRVPFLKSVDDEKEWKRMADQMGCDSAQVEIMMKNIQEQLKKLEEK
ncbi:unnamed protein product [Ambrosiozyma monospora]|uniref:Unnamed protein product n=1 Tax=Ambrosiozyma monospora TaxID=43982 RepID=A0A9W7DK22_AMBMO|nr:unnamed protein product [Ambrosiozyma monospora]